MKSNGKVDLLFEKLRLYSSNDQVASKEFILTLVNHGGISEMEARKVALNLEVNSKIKVSKFQELFDRSS